jgi:hypothetical protein
MVMIHITVLRADTMRSELRQQHFTGTQYLHLQGTMLYSEYADIMFVHNVHTHLPDKVL